LCSKIKKYQASFGATHLILLLSVPSEERLKFAKEAIQGRWTFSRLKAVTRERFGWRRHGGRRPYVPEEPGERLVYLDILCVKYCRWCEAAQPELPPDLHAQVATAIKGVRRVQEAATKALRGVQEAAAEQRQRPRPRSKARKR
jgi:hypothetical protein